MSEIKNIREMSDKETHELQTVMLEMLEYFLAFCKENNLRFYLAGGCLIGAIRHGGFIPWDDDIDCFMPRPDYEKLSLIWKTKGDIKKYTYCRTDESNNFHHAAASLRNNDTTFINIHSQNEDICHGIALEIAPIDGCPNNIFKRIQQLINAFLYGLFNVQRLPDNKGKVIRVVSKIIYFIIPSRKIRYHIWKKCEIRMSQYDFDDSEYCTELIGSLKGMQIKHPKSRFEPAKYVNFEHLLVPVMNKYDEYLELIWGDYMELPPEEERVAKHNTIYINTDESYKKYKGIYYLRK